MSWLLQNVASNASSPSCVFRHSPAPLHSGNNLCPTQPEIDLPNGNPEPVRVIFSCENTWYMWWQAEFLHYTYAIAGMQAELTALVANTDDPPKQFTCNVVPVANYKDFVPDAPLLSLNKSGGIAEWAALDGPRDETVLIVDPDSMFLRPIADPGPIPADSIQSQSSIAHC